MLRRRPLPSRIWRHFWYYRQFGLTIPQALRAAWVAATA